MQISLLFKIPNFVVFCTTQLPWSEINLWIIDKHTKHQRRTNLQLDMIGTHQVLAYADDVKLKYNYIRKIKKNEEILLNVCRDIGLAINIQKTK